MIVPTSPKHNKLGEVNPAVIFVKGSETSNKLEGISQSFASFTIIEYEPALKLSK